jgi:hypothetical protein
MSTKSTISVESRQGASPDFIDKMGPVPPYAAVLLRAHSGHPVGLADAPEADISTSSADDEEVDCE